MVEVKVKRLKHDARLPTRAKQDDACFDLYAHTDIAGEPLFVGETRRFYTGIALEIPVGYEGVVRGRSGNSANGLIVPIGTIDAGYRGDVGVIVYNASREIMTIKRGDRIAQIAIRPIPDVSFVEADELSETSRGTGGFGSSGR